MKGEKKWIENEDGENQGRRIIYWCINSDGKEEKNSDNTKEDPVKTI